MATHAPITSRRTLLAGFVASLPAASAAALTIDQEIERDLADLPSPSAEEHDRELVALGARYDAALAAEEWACDETDRLSDLCVRPVRPEALRRRQSDRGLGSGTWIEAREVEENRRFANEWNPRVTEYVAAFDAWSAACHAEQERIGLRSAEAREDALRAQRAALADEIMTARPGGLAGLRVKARVAAGCGSGAYGLTVVRDLLTMGAAA